MGRPRIADLPSVAQNHDINPRTCRAWHGLASAGAQNAPVEPAARLPRSSARIRCAARGLIPGGCACR